MKISLNMLHAAYHANELMGMLSKLSTAETESIATALDEGNLPEKAATALRRLLTDGDGSRRTKRKSEATFEEFRFEDVMNRLRNAVVHARSPSDIDEVDWLLKIILMSPAVFDSVREVDTFLSNMTGTEHGTKSTGRDRVVDWYFKFINSLPQIERGHIYLRIARHLFGSGKSNYREWKEVLYGSGK